MKKGVLTSLLMSAFLVFGGCSSMFKSEAEYETSWIENPFSNYRPNKRNQNGIVLRTKKGDQSLELEVIGSENQRHYSDLVIPVEPTLRGGSTSRGLASTSPAQLNSAEAMSYQDAKTTFSDNEIVKTFPKGRIEDDWKKKEIEQSLGLVPVAEAEPEMEGSYLAKIDFVKQLYQYGRFEAALIELDRLMKSFPTNPKLYEMRGTVLNRLGYEELAMKAWSQALEFEPGNQSLKKFLERKKRKLSGRGVASP